MVTCQHCGREFRNRQVLSVHIFHRHSQTSLPNSLSKDKSSKFSISEELNKVLEQVKQTTLQTVTQLRQQEIQTEKEKVKEKLFNEALGKISEIAEKVSLHEIKFAEAEKQTKTICQDFPGLCERIDVLEKKISLAKPPADKPKEKLLGTDHETIEEILSCPSCLLDHLKKVGLDKASSELCGSDEACQAIVVELVKKGFKVGPPTKDKENVTAETKKGSHFSLGRSQG